jgi:hypothetical protein
VVVELLDYLVVVTETVVRDDRQNYLQKKIRSLLINIESISKDGFMTALAVSITEESYTRRGQTGEALGGDDDLDEVDSYREYTDPDDPRSGSNRLKESETRQISFPN